MLHGQQANPNTLVQSSGTCSPTFIGNQGYVRFTCNTAMNKATASKIVSLLNTILKKNTNNDAINQKLDEILESMRCERDNLVNCSPSQIAKTSTSLIRRLTDDTVAALNTIAFFGSGPQNDGTVYQQNRAREEFAEKYRDVYMSEVISVYGALLGNIRNIPDSLIPSSRVTIHDRSEEYTEPDAMYDRLTDMCTLLVALEAEHQLEVTCSVNDIAHKLQEASQPRPQVPSRP
jgi:hypothetical protein